MAWPMSACDRFSANCRLPEKSVAAALVVIRSTSSGALVRGNSITVPVCSCCCCGCRKNAIFLFRRKGHIHQRRHHNSIEGALSQLSQSQSLFTCCPDKLLPRCLLLLLPLLLLFRRTCLQWKKSSPSFAYYQLQLTTGPSSLENSELVCTHTPGHNLYWKCKLIILMK